MNTVAFFTAARTVTAGEVAGLTGARLADESAGRAIVRGLASLRNATAGDLVFADGKRQMARVGGLTAAAILCSQDIAPYVPQGIAVLVTQAPQRAFAQVGRLLFPQAAEPRPLTGAEGVSPAAHVDPTARIEEGVVIEAGAVIAAHVQIGSHTVVAPHAVIGQNCRIGRRCFIGPNVVVQNALVGNHVVIHGGAQVGQDGFGYVPGRTGPEKVPQIGRVVIQDGVEIGACTTIDRGALDDTVIGENSKIDNLVQIAHNVRIGRNCLIASQSGISGSVTVGDNAMLGGRAGIADHVAVGSDVQLGAASGVLTDVPSGERWGGFPAQPLRQWLRGVAVLKRLAGDATRRKDDA